jgi:hypothetical protein
MSDNPQYGVTFNGSGEAYFVFRLKNRTSSYQSEQYGYMNIQTVERGGGLIKRPDKAITIGSSGPVNSATQAVKVDIPDNLNFPYTVTCLLATMDKAEEDFNLQVFGQKGKMI